MMRVVVEVVEQHRTHCQCHTLAWRKSPLGPQSLSRCQWQGYGELIETFLLTIAEDSIVRTWRARTNTATRT